MSHKRKGNDLLKPTELHQRLDVSLSGIYPGSASLYNKALAALVITLNEDELEAATLWFDYGPVPGFQGLEAESGMHIRLISRTGILTVDQGFDDQGAPIARLVPWSRVIALNVVATATIDEMPQATNTWIETSDGQIDFTAPRHHTNFGAIIAAVQRHLR